MNRTSAICRLLTTIIIGSVFALTSACSQPKTPQEVAEGFWSALEAGDERRVKKHIIDEQAAALESLDDVLSVSDPKFDRIIIDGETASIETTVTVEGDKPFEFPIKTYLVMEDEHWKVDYQKTIDAIGTAGNLAMVIERVQEFGTALQDGIERSVQELEQALPKIEKEIARFEEQFKQHVPELRKRLDTFAKELEDALKNPPVPESKQEDKEESIEI